MAYLLTEMIPDLFRPVEPWPVRVTVPAGYSVPIPELSTALNEREWHFEGTMHQPRGREVYQVIEKGEEDWDRMTMLLYDTKTKEQIEKVPLYLTSNKNNLQAFHDLSKPEYLSFGVVEQ